MTSPFPLPLAFTSQAFKKTRQSDGSLTPADANAAYNVAQAAKKGGSKTVAVQIGPTGYDACADADDVKALKGYGFTVVAWGVVDGNAAQDVVTLGVDGWMPQVEGDSQYNALISALGAGVGKSLPRAVVTTYGGLDTLDHSRANGLIAAGIDHAFVEIYASDGHTDVDGMLHQGTVYGFDAAKLTPTLGTYRQETPSSYTWKQPCNALAVFLLEPMSDTQLAAFAALPAPAAPVPPPAPVLPNPATLNSEISKLAHSWLDPQLPNLKPQTRLRNIARISETTDAEWVAVCAQVQAALDGTAPTQADVDALNAKVADLTTQLQSTTDSLTKTTDSLNQTTAALTQSQNDLTAANVKIANAKTALA